MDIETRAKLRKAILNFARLESRIVDPIEAFAVMVRKAKGGSVQETPDGPLMHIDRGHDVLFVAHLDTAPAVAGGDWLLHGLIHKEPFVVSPWLDDRLGVFLGLDVLPVLGLEYDILLCTNEEKGNSTAYYFQTEKKYRYIFELDRMGTDVVHYQYRDEDLGKLLRKAGFPAYTNGSYTDIVELEHLGVLAFNVGIAYEAPHSRWCHANLDLTAKQVERFYDFYQATEGETFPFDPAKAYTGRRRKGVASTAVYIPAGRGGTAAAPYAGNGYWNGGGKNYQPTRHYPFRKGEVVFNTVLKRLYTIAANEYDSYVFINGNGEHRWIIDRPATPKDNQPNGPGETIRAYCKESELLHLVRDKDGNPGFIILENWIKEGRPKTVKVVRPPEVEHLTGKLDLSEQALLAALPEVKVGKKHRFRLTQLKAGKPPAKKTTTDQPYDEHWDLLPKCDGIPSNPAVLAAREEFEEWFFAAGLLSPSTKIASITATKEHPSAMTPRMFYGERVLTDKWGEGRIDCYNPIYPEGDVTWYWVRFPSRNEYNSAVELVPSDEFVALYVSNSDVTPLWGEV